MATPPDYRTNRNVFAEASSEDLHENVHRAVPLLARGFLADDDSLGAGDLDQIYEASLTYLYRLVVVLCAESDGCDAFDIDDERYRRRYSLDALKRRVAEKLDAPGHGYREQETTLWDRLTELFELVDGGSESIGVADGDCSVPAYHGELFETDPDLGSKDMSERTPDRTLDRTSTVGEAVTFLGTHAVGDAWLARVLDLLTRCDADRGSGREFVDYSSLDVRHLGSIYESVLEYDLDIADEPLVAVREDGRQRWVSESETEAERRGANEAERRGANGAERRGAEATEENGETEAEPPHRVEAGEPYLTTEEGTRKTTGAYYTPEFVAEYVVERTLEPLVDDIRADLDPDDPAFAERFADRVFDLSVLDPAMGSGHFLVAAVEYLARAVVEVQQEQAERLGAETIRQGCNVHRARQRVAQQCVYGVDRDGLAVELAKASLWLRTLAAEQPLGSVDHHLERGDSLVGTGVEEIERLARDAETNAGLADSEATRTDAVGRPTAMANVRTAERFGLDVPAEAYDRMAEAVDDAARDELKATRWFRTSQSMADERDFFHWRLAFPEVFDDGDGFDAVVGNPPYVRSRNLSDDVKEYYRGEYDTADGAYDLYVPFLERACDLGARVSFVVPNKWTTTDYGRALRDRLLDHDRLREVLDASNLDVFPDADIYPVVVTCDRTGRDGGERTGDERADERTITVRHADDPANLDAAPTTTVTHEFVDRLGGRVIPLDLDPAFADVASSVLADCDRLGDHVEMAEAVHTGNVREKLLVDDPSSTGDPDACRKVVGGSSVSRYRLDWDGRWIRHDEQLVHREAGEYANLRDPDLFETEKLFVRDISRRPVAVYDDEGYYGLNTLYSVRKRDYSDLSLRYLLGVFDSAFVGAYVRQVYGGTRVSGDYLRFKPTFAERIPVPDPDSAVVEPGEIAARVGVEDVPDDPETAVATLTERLREAKDEYAGLNLDVLEYLGDDPESFDAVSGPTLGELGSPVEGVGDPILAETASDRAGLRVGDVELERDGESLTLSATARYKPEDGATDTDEWGYAETGFVPAMELSDLERAFGARAETVVALVEAFVPAAADRGNGFAGFRREATKTNSLQDRLRALTLPEPAVVVEAGAEYRNVRARAETLDDRIEAMEDAIDGIVYRLYGLNEAEIETVESLGERG